MHKGSTRRDKSKGRLAPYLIALALSLSAAIACLTALSQSSPAQTGDGVYQIDPLPVDDEDTRQIQRFARQLPAFVQPAMSKVLEKRTPMLVFRRWAQTPKPFFATFLFCTLIGLVGTAFFSRQIAVAQECCRRQFWRSLGRAILVGVTLLLLVRVFHLLQITQALSMLFMALVQLGIVAGLAVGIALIGERLAERTGLAKLSYFSSRPRWTAVTKIILGSLVIALIVQIPGIGLLPRIGIRIAMLIAILGVGGLLKTHLGTRPPSS